MPDPQFGYYCGVKSYRLRIVPERAPEVQRVFEVAALHTLHDVHLAIQDEFELQDDHPYAFYMSGKHWDKASEISGPGASRRPRAGQTRLFELRLEAGKRFSYVFDLGDELWHAIEVESVEDSETPPAEPRLVESVGEAPAQYPDDEWDEIPISEVTPEVRALVPLAAELARLLSQESDDEEADDPPPEALRSAQRVALELASRLEQDGERFWVLESVSEQSLLQLLAELPLALARAGMVDEAAELGLALAFVDPPTFLGERAVLLAGAGRREAALAQVAANLASMPDDPGVEMLAGDALLSLGDAGAAEARFRSALEHAEEDFEREDVIDRLLHLLTTQGREEEVAALRSAEHAVVVDLGGVPLRRMADDWQETVRRSTPKVGRNDLCPCGSSKKYKKCCGQ